MIHRCGPAGTAIRTTALLWRRSHRTGGTVLSESPIM